MNYDKYIIIVVDDKRTLLLLCTRICVHFQFKRSCSLIVGKNLNDEMKI